MWPEMLQRDVKHSCCGEAQESLAICCCVARTRSRERAGCTCPVIRCRLDGLWSTSPAAAAWSGKLHRVCWRDEATRIALIRHGKRDSLSGFSTNGLEQRSELHFFFSTWIWVTRQRESLLKSSSCHPWVLESIFHPLILRQYCVANKVASWCRTCSETCALTHVIFAPVRLPILTSDLWHQQGIFLHITAAADSLDIFSCYYHPLWLPGSCQRCEVPQWKSQEGSSSEWNTVWHKPPLCSKSPTLLS